MALSQGDVDEAVLFAKVTSVMTFVFTAFTCASSHYLCVFH